MINDLKELMLKKASSAVAVYHKIVNSYNNYDNALFYLVEGEDFYYYQSRIVTYSDYSDTEIFYFPCDGKENLIEARKLIKNIQFKENQRMCYFVDRDYGLHKTPPDVYVTPNYSIENFYCCKECFQKVLINLLTIHYNSNDYIECIKLYDKNLNEYHKITVPLNILAYSIREYEKIHSLCRVDLSKIKFHHLIEDDNFETFKIKAFQQEFFIGILNFNNVIDEIQFRKNSLLFSGDSQDKLRGKYEMYFLKWFLSKLKTIVTDGNGKISPHRYANFNFEVNLLQVLSPYANTPNSLIEYIQKYGKKGVKNEEKFAIAQQ
ncbi:MAG: DUF4435 domain-containing protein [Candidatus Cloacimonetes bacterium]|nr:DUF4435 domain-containing protein [Candidatus Cloacimonadota bacterium]